MHLLRKVAVLIRPAEFLKMWFLSVELAYPESVTIGFGQSNARIFKVSPWLNIRGYECVEYKWNENDI